MEKIFITVTGLHHYLGNDFFEKGMEVTLKKEPNNLFDKEAIEVTMEALGRIGHVANSVSTVIGECYSAGRIFDKFKDIAKAKVLYVIKDRDSLVCEYMG